MLVYRLCRKPFGALDGEGARLYGGRWNSPGRPVVYTSSSLALGALEYLIHLDPALVPLDLIALTIEIPDAVSARVADVSSLPTDWARTPASADCQDLGDAWLAAGVTAVLQVPAAPIPEEWNFLLNPSHTDAKYVKTIGQRKFVYDPRLLG